MGGCNPAACARYAAKCEALGEGWELATWQDLDAYDPGLLKPLLTSVCMVHNLESALVARYSPPGPNCCVGEVSARPPAASHSHLPPPRPISVFCLISA